MNLNKKLNHLLLVKVGFLFFLLGFLFYFYQLYSDFIQYGKQKNDPGTGIVRSEILQQTNNIFSSKLNFQQLPQVDIFSVGPKSQKFSNRRHLNKKTDEFDLLGVVKVGQLFAVIQFKTEKKVKLFPEKSNINQGHYIEKIGIHDVLIRDEFGVVRTHKVFKYEEIKKINDKELQKFSDSPPISKSKRKIRKRSQKKND